MAATPSRQSNFITLVRNVDELLWKVANELPTYQAEWNSNDYGNTLLNFEGENDGLDKDDIGPVVFDVANALVVLRNTYGAQIGAILR